MSQSKFRGRYPAVWGLSVAGAGVNRGAFPGASCVHTGRPPSAGVISEQTTTSWSSVRSPAATRILPCGCCPCRAPHHIAHSCPARPSMWGAGGGLGAPRGLVGGRAPWFPRRSALTCRPTSQPAPLRMVLDHTSLPHNPPPQEVWFVSYGAVPLNPPYQSVCSPWSETPLIPTCKTPTTRQTRLPSPSLFF